MILIKYLHHKSDQGSVREQDIYHSSFKIRKFSLIKNQITHAQNIFILWLHKLLYIYFTSNQAYFILIFNYFIKLALHLHSSFITILYDSLYHCVFGKPWEVGFGWKKSCCQTSSEGACDPLSVLPTRLQDLIFS
jgi:hypothetical protein